MDDWAQIYPFEFFMQATPRSHQGKRAAVQRWIEDVAAAASLRSIEITEWYHLDKRPLALTIYYFSDAPLEGDVDNLVKPIQDALIKVAFLDDNQVERVVAQKFEPQEDWDIREPSLQLAKVLDTKPPVIYVRVDDDLGWRFL